RLTADRGHEVALLLLLCAELPDRGCGDVDVRPDARGGAARADARHLLAEHGLMQVVAAMAAVLGWVLQPEQPLGGQLGKDIIREPLLLLPLLRVRGELALEEAPYRRAQLLVFLAEGRVDHLGVRIPERVIAGDSVRFA